MMIIAEPRKKVKKYFLPQGGSLKGAADCRRPVHQYRRLALAVQTANHTMKTNATPVMMRPT